MAEDIRTFADKYDINNNPIGDTFQEVMGLASQAPAWRSGIEANDKIIEENTGKIDAINKEISKNEKEMTVLKKESERTGNWMDVVRSRQQ